MRSVEQFVEEQVAIWEADEQLEKRQRQTGRGKTGPTSFGPCVLISREGGAGGLVVAKLVGERLGWHVFDREIVDEIAQKTNVRRQLLESLDEQARGAIENFIITMLDRESIDDTRYEYQLRQVVLTLGHHGRAVIVGRGGCLILPSQFGLSVRLIAPLKTRVQRIAAEQKVPFEKAERGVKKLDRDRAKFIRHHFGRDIGDSLLHDLIINTDAMSKNATAETILTALHEKLGITSTKQVGTDETLKVPQLNNQTVLPATL
jgi:cytidylate kinase